MSEPIAPLMPHARGMCWLHTLHEASEEHVLAEALPDGALVARLSDGPAENFCRPAVDPMLRSLAALCGGRVLAVILTGMGQDGLAGCRAVAAAGGTVLAQDEASSVVWGMPGAVARAGQPGQRGPAKRRNGSSPRRRPQPRGRVPPGCPLTRGSGRRGRA